MATEQSEHSYGGAAARRRGGAAARTDLPTYGLP